MLWRFAEGPECLADRLQCPTAIQVEGRAAAQRADARVGLDHRVPIAADVAADGVGDTRAGQGGQV